MLLVLTAGANASEEIEKEVTFAASLRKVIFPIRATEVVLSGTLLYQLQTRQWRDIFVNRDAVIGEIVNQIKAMRKTSGTGVIVTEGPATMPIFEVQNTRTLQSLGPDQGNLEKQTTSQPQIHSAGLRRVEESTTTSSGFVPIDPVAHGPHSLLNASVPLLLLLGRLRASPSSPKTDQLCDKIATSLVRFEAEARSAKVSAVQVNAAKYALAATADDVLRKLPKDSNYSGLQGKHADLFLR